MFKNPISDVYVELRIKDGKRETQTHVIPDSSEQLAEFMGSPEWSGMIKGLADSAVIDFEEQRIAGIGVKKELVN